MRIVPTILAAVTGLILILIGDTATAFRCGTKVISAGDFKPKVLKECGEPTHIEVWHEERVFRDFGTYDSDDRRGYRWNREPFLVKELVTVEQWTYNLGYHRLIHYLIFENGKLIRITTGEYGY